MYAKCTYTHKYILQSTHYVITQYNIIYSISNVVPYIEYSSLSSYTAVALE